MYTNCWYYTLYSFCCNHRPTNVKFELKSAEYWNLHIKCRPHDSSLSINEM